MATQSTDVLPQEEANAIAALDEAKRQIDIARANEDIDTLLEWQDRAAAVQHYIRRRDEARELADNAGEIKVRAEAALGKLDLAVSPGRGRRAAAEDDAEPEEAPLASLQPNRRSAYRVLGKLSGNELDEVVGRLRADEESDKGVTTARAVHEARGMLPKEERARPNRQRMSARNSSPTTRNTSGRSTLRCHCSPGWVRRWWLEPLTPSGAAWPCVCPMT